MKIKFLVDVKHSDYSFNAGDEVELDQTTAEMWLGADKAVPIAELPQEKSEKRVIKPAEQR